MIKNIKLNKKSFKKIIDSPCICTSYHGKIYKIDDNTLAKIYYRDIMDDKYKEYDSSKIKKLVVEHRKRKNKYGVDPVKKNKIIKMEAVTNSSSDLFKGILSYHGAVIGITLNNYDGYEKLEDIYLYLTDEEREYIFLQIDKIISNLIEQDVYPFDIKGDSVLVNMNNLEVKLIDLDDEITNYSLSDNEVTKKIKKENVLKREKNLRLSLNKKVI